MYGIQITCRIMAVVKVETDLITFIAAKVRGRAVILVIMFVEIFKTEVIVFICNIMMNLMSR